MTNLINDKDNFFTYLKCNKELDKPLIISSPHSGILLDSDLLDKRNKDIHSFDSMQDMYVNELSNGLEKFGFTVLQSNISRIVIDLNRNINEINPKVIKNLPSNIEVNLSDKVRAGIGLIAMKDASGKNIYDKKLDWLEVKSRIDNYYIPWHKALKNEISMFLNKFKRALIIDMHSMPSEKIYNNKLADFVIGNNFGNSSSEVSIKILSSLIKSYGYSVSINNPYPGGYITKNYSSIDKNIQCIQLEIKKNLYMNEKDFNKNENFEQFSKNLKQIIYKFFNEFDKKIDINLAAE
tara:strand:- start:310 stop:1191 length:882 start_codon:yes stop_codon:yes gene_type:complete